MSVPRIIRGIGARFAGAYSPIKVSVPSISISRQMSTVPPTLSERNLALAKGILAGERASLAKAITLMESSRSDHRVQADLLQQYLLSNRRQKSSNWASPSFRIGVAGPPGAGKSSMIEVLGTMLVNKGHKVAVIPIDPSSSLSGGSILGDKTRMDTLSKSESAYVRASPTRCALGGIAEHTADVVSLCESGGYDTVIVESVGLGQSEIELDQAVDIFILLLPPGAGDDLQASKKGVMEFADLVVVNKADGDLLPLAKATKSDYTYSVRMIRRKCIDWDPQVLMISARTGDGMESFVEIIRKFDRVMVGNNKLVEKRGKQSMYWMWAHFQKLIIDSLGRDAVLQRKTDTLKAQLMAQNAAPRVAAASLYDTFLSRK